MAKKSKQPAPKKQKSARKGELGERDLDRAAGGLSDIQITKVVDKTSPKLF